jgi:murein DD-endopeptidase MepM/ murein hydrolase activator NlpD
LAKKREVKMEHIPSMLPLNKNQVEKFAAPFGMRRHPILGYKRMHYGADIVAEKGTDVYATGKGKVIQARYNGGFGRVVKIDHGYGYVSVYAHLSKITVKEGQEVSRGDLIGLVGNTGLSTGPHLHYEVRINNKAVDPSIFY